MSSTASLLLSLDEYHQRYAGENGYEYWFGEVVRKPVPTWLHSILQAMMETRDVWLELERRSKKSERL